MPSLFIPSSFDNHLDVFGPQKGDLKKAFWPFFNPSDIYQQVLVHKDAQTDGTVYAFPGRLIAAAGKTVLSKTERYMQAIARRKDTPKPQKGWLNPHSDFQQHLVDVAYDISDELGHVFQQLHKRLNPSDIDKILRDPKTLDRHIEKTKLGLQAAADKKEFDTFAGHMWEFNQLSGAGLVFALACVRAHFSAQSEEYESALVVAKDFLNHRRMGFALKMIGRVFHTTQQMVYMDHDDDQDWAGFVQAVQDTYTGKRRILVRP